MRTTYTKPNSHTQQQARKYVSVVDEILEKSGIDMEAWLGLLFESGCQYMELIADYDTDFVNRHLQDSKYNFWAWWMNFWLNDDAKLLDTNGLLSGGGYAYLKSQLMTLIDTKINTNEKVQD